MKANQHHSPIPLKEGQSDRWGLTMQNRPIGLTKAPRTIKRSDPSSRPPHRTPHGSPATLRLRLYHRRTPSLLIHMLTMPSAAAPREK